MTNKQIINGADQDDALFLMASKLCWSLVKLVFALFCIIGAGVVARLLFVLFRFGWNFPWLN
jgi:hypothetical protein